MDSDEEAYILLLLSDSNLPTGSFVASAGLESYVTHGFLSSPSSLEGTDKVSLLNNFVRDSVSSYARSALPFVYDAHRVLHERILAIAVSPSAEREPEGLPQRAENTLAQIYALDALYDAMTLNHVARRASKSQGVALLTLYSKGFSKLALRTLSGHSDPVTEAQKQQKWVDMNVGTFIDQLKLAIRREDTHGHLPICWGVLTAALGLSSERSQFLHLFLHARGLVSAAVRMNTLGPYAAQQLLLHTIRPIVKAEAVRCQHMQTGLNLSDPPPGSALNSEFDSEDFVPEGPAMTWPLGEILAGRHDLQHSRIFNS